MQDNIKNTRQHRVNNENVNREKSRLGIVTNTMNEAYTSQKVSEMKVLLYCGSDYDVNWMQVIKMKVRV